MAKLRVFRYCSSAAFIALLVVCGLPLVRVLEYDISIFDFISMSVKIDDLIEQFGEYAEFIRREIVPWRVMCAAFVVLPLIEAVLTIIIKTKQVFIVTIIGLVVNNLLGFIFIDNISAFFEYINGSIAMLFMDEPLHLENGPIIIWCVIHGLILAASVTGFILETIPSREKKKRFDMGDVILAEIKDNKEHDNSKNEICKEENVTEKDQRAGVKVSEDFYGAIVCEKGHYRDKVIFMKKNEMISFGSEDTDDVFIVGAIKKKSCCLISYEREIGEYIVQPLHSRSVFLEKGQPLGKNRRYCIPRGMVVVIDSGKNRFRLV